MQPVKRPCPASPSPTLTFTRVWSCAQARALGSPPCTLIWSAKFGPPSVTALEAQGLWLSAPVTLALPLPPGTTSEVVLDISPYPGCGLSGRSSGLLLDEIRVE